MDQSTSIPFVESIGNVKEFTSGNFKTTDTKIGAISDNSKESRRHERRRRHRKEGKQVFDPVISGM